MRTLNLSIPKMRNKSIMVLGALALAACSSVLDVPPTSSIAADVAISDANGARAALAGAYSGLQQGGLYGQRLIVWTELLSDNARHTGTFDDYADAYAHRLRADNNAVTTIWNHAYNEINRVNEILDKVPALTDLPDAEKTEMLGEAHFLRALMYHDLVRLYGGVPLRTAPVKSAVEAGEIARASVAETYTQILADLGQAETMITAGRSQTRQASIGAVYALESRVKLYQQDWAGAEAAAAKVEGMGYSLATNFSDLFDATGSNTPEDIFRITFTATQANSDGFYFLPKPLGGRYEVAPSTGASGIIAAFDPASGGNIANYAPADKRGQWSISRSGTRTYAAKYRNSAGDEDIHVIRLGEVILNRAEALANLGRLPEAVAEYNRVRVRAGLAPDPAPTVLTTQASVLAAIARERRLELAFEGDRWPDMVRKGIATGIASGSATQVLLPIPQAEIDVAPNVQQNAGY
jgi:hypothetical protein